MSLPGRFLSIGGQRVFYHRTGRGRPLVLVHGFLVSHWCWRDVIPGLATDHDVIAIDLPGFGESDRPSPADFRYTPQGYTEVVIGVLDALGLDRVVLAGHSMGGGISLYTAARQPERVEQLIVIDPLVYSYPIPVEGQIVLAPYIGPAIFRTLYTRGIVRRYLTKNVYHDPSLVTDEWVDYLWERLNRPGGFDAAHACIRLSSDPSPITRCLRAVRAPALVVWGAEDKLFSPAFAPRLQADLPGAQLAMIPDCGHAPPEERPEELLRLMRAFLDAPAASPRLAAVSP